MLISSIGALTYPRLNVFNKLSIEGTEHLKDLPEANVLLVSNHQTYFMDVIAMYHAILSARAGFRNTIANPVYLLKPWPKLFYVAAAETMSSGFIPKVFTYAGSIPVKRTWRQGEQHVKRSTDPQDIKKIERGLRNGWVVSFPQGTTKPGAPGRVGTAHLIKHFKPVVIPLVIDGFNTAFDKTGLKSKKSRVKLSLRFKPPVKLNYEDPPKVILAEVMKAIEEYG